MPNLANTTLYAMYVIGKVESEWNWASTYTVDAITIGMMQEWGPNALDLLTKLKNNGDTAAWSEFAAAAPDLASDVETYANNRNWWETRYLTSSEVAAWEKYATYASNHKSQQEKWYEQFQNEYVPAAEKNGFSQDRPQTLILWICAYHQSPRRAIEVVRSCGGNATLETLKNTILNNGVLGKYRNRYNTAYSMLKDWDGESAPPDFGQVTDASSGGDSSTGSAQQNDYIKYIQKRDGYLYVFGATWPNGLLCVKSGANIWSPSYNGVGQANTTNNETYNQGSNTGSDAAQKVVELYKSWEGKFTYSQGGSRLNLDSWSSDCSGTIYMAYKQITGLNVGTWTGDMITKGSQVFKGKGKTFDSSKCNLGDLIIINWSGGDVEKTTSHVEMYIGDGKCMGHGGGKNHPNGPWIKDSVNDYLSSKCTWQVRRYL